MKMDIRDIEHLAADRLDPIDDDTLHEMYEEDLHTHYHDIDVCGLQMDPVYVLKTVDEPAYNEGFNDWIDSQVRDCYFFYHDGEYYQYDQFMDAIDEIQSENEEIE